MLRPIGLALRAHPSSVGAVTDRAYSKNHFAEEAGGRSSSAVSSSHPCGRDITSLRTAAVASQPRLHSHQTNVKDNYDKNTRKSADPRSRRVDPLRRWRRLTHARRQSEWVAGARRYL